MKALAEKGKLQSDMAMDKVRTILRTRKAVSPQQEQDNTWSPSYLVGRAETHTQNADQQTRTLQKPGWNSKFCGQHIFIT